MYEYLYIELKSHTVLIYVCKRVSFIIVFADVHNDFYPHFIFIILVHILYQILTIDCISYAYNIRENNIISDLIIIDFFNSNNCQLYF